MSLIKQKRLTQGGLVLQRKENESICIFDRNDPTFVPIVIKITKVAGNRVSIHVNAPEHIGIMRSELIAKGVCDVAQNDCVVVDSFRTKAKAS